MMSGTVTQIEISEKVVIQPTSIKTLQSNLGVEGSQDVIERAVFEMSERLNRLEKAQMSGDIPLLRKIAKSLIGISEQVGLLQFSAIARDVVTCAARCDRVSTMAVSARLIRVGEASLYAAVETAEPSQ